MNKPIEFSGIGGIEQNLHIILPEDSDGSRGYQVAFEAMRNLKDLYASTGGYIWTVDDFSVISSLFSPRGDKMALEDVLWRPDGALVSILLELSSRETDILGVTNARERCMADFCEALVDAPAGTIMTSVGFLPRFGRASGLSMGFDLNLDMEGILEKRVASELDSAFILLMQFVAPGGISQSGTFSISPLCASSNPYGRNPYPPYAFRHKRYPVWSSVMREASRLHVTLEAPFRHRTGTLIAWSTTSLLLELARHDLLSGLEMTNPRLTGRVYSENGPCARTRLTNNKTATLADLQALLLERIDVLMGLVETTETAFRLFGLIRDGLAALLDNRTGRTADILSCFEYFRKRRMYEDFLERAHGLDLDRAQTLTKAVRLISCPIHSLSTMSDREIARTIRGRGGSTGASLRRLLVQNCVDFSEIREAASMLKAWESIEIHLYRLFPDPPPLEAEDIATRLLLLPEGSPVASRADVRSRIARYLAAFPDSRSVVSADWSNLYCPSRTSEAGIYEFFTASFGNSPKNTSLKSIERTRLSIESLTEKPVSNAGHVPDCIMIHFLESSTQRTIGDVPGAEDNDEEVLMTSEDGSQTALFDGDQYDVPLQKLSIATFGDASRGHIRNG